ncbi:MAG: hypothetical protein A2792_01370 [Sphingomonadales bacterium RIFCSPHIGHO2_01_FULL_65_20]|nr:MAG: hypothetical protein A2792_01370 [Sphingomonadales bacterium RIFCSPHIGHO2_01_FULL_65_20]
MPDSDATNPKDANRSDPRDLADEPVAEPSPSVPTEDKTAKPSAMIDEGERPSADHGSVEGLATADRPGGMAGEG